VLECFNSLHDATVLLISEPEFLQSADVLQSVEEVV
jgi:hypothetical protein